MSKAAELCQKAIQNELQYPSWEHPRHPLGHPCELNLQFFSICSILGVPRCPQSSQTEPRWVPKIIKIKQKLIPETCSEQATRHNVFEDAFRAEFTQNLEGPTSRKHCYLLHGSHILTSMVQRKFCQLLLSKRMTLKPLLNLLFIHGAPKRHCLLYPSDAADE